MVIVIVRWYIKKEQDKKFKATWQGMNPKYKEGLFREFFSKPISKPDEKYHTLDVESKHYTTYINVGVWRKLDDFNKAVSLIQKLNSKKGYNLKSKAYIFVKKY